MAFWFADWYAGSVVQGLSGPLNSLAVLHLGIGGAETCGQFGHSVCALAGTWFCGAWRILSTYWPVFWAALARVPARRSLSNLPGSRLFSVTPRAANSGWYARAATKPVSPERTLLDGARMSMDALTALEATLTMRPKPRYAMSVMLARISSMGMSMLACTACCQAAASNWRKSSGGRRPPRPRSPFTHQRLRTTQARPGPALCWPRTRAPICLPASHLRSLFLSSHCLFAGLSDPAPATAAPAPDIARSTGSQKAKVWHASRPERCCDLGRSLASQSGNRRQHRVRTDPTAWPGCSGMQTTSPGRCAPTRVWQIRLDKRCK